MAFHIVKQLFIHYYASGVSFCHRSLAKGQKIYFGMDSDLKNNYLDRINRVLLYYFRFPEETENIHSAFSANTYFVELKKNQYFFPIRLSFT
jgi:hypothetical protein